MFLFQVEFPDALLISRQGSHSPTDDYSPDYNGYMFEVPSIEEDRPPEYDTVVPPTSQQVCW